MSVIRVQAFQFSIVNYLATALAAVSTLWIYPLDFDAYGLAQFLVSMAFLFIPIATLGTLTIVVKFFPEYSGQGLRKAYLFNVLVLGFGSLALAAVVAILVNEPILKFIEFLRFDAYLIAKHKYTIAILIAFMFYNNALTMHASNYNKIALPSAFQNLLPKLVLPVLVILAYSEAIHMAWFARLWVLSFALTSIGLTLYLSQIGALDLRPKLHFFTRGKLRRLFSYSGYVGAGQMGNILIGKIDVIMVATLIGLKETGIYGMALFIGNVLAIPTSAVWQISAPVISKAVEEHDWDRIREVYKKSSTNLLVIGTFMYFLILGTLDAVLHLSPKYLEMSGIIPLFAIIGISRLMDMGVGINQQILTYSSRYRSVIVFVAIMAITNVILNYVLVTGMHGAIGAAISTTVTVFIYQALKYFYVHEKFGIHPFTGMTLRIVLVFGILFVYFLLLPRIGSPFVQAAIYAVGLAILYLACIRLLRIESDVTTAVYGYAEKALQRLRIGRK